MIARRSPSPLSPRRFVTAITPALIACGTQRSVLVDVERFGSFLEDGLGIRDIHRVVQPDVEAFVGARRSDGAPATYALRRVRLRAIRLALRIAREIGIVMPDPTAGIVPGPKTSVRARALTDSEIVRGRAHAADALSDLRRPIAWALAEATARTGEIGQVVVGDVDVDRGLVHLPGTRGIDARVGELTDWALPQIVRRIRGAAGDEPLIVWRRHPSQLTAASCETIRETLKAAGLSGSGVRPVSIAAWRGRSLLEQGLPIEDVACRLGMRSLDETAQLIRFDWRGGS